MAMVDGPSSRVAPCSLLVLQHLHDTRLDTDHPTAHGRFNQQVIDLCIVGFFFMLRPGEQLTNTRGQRAKVRADGSLIADDVKGSIHQVGAALEGAPSCNGWTYWHFEREGKRIPIDVLRQQIRSEMN